MSTNLLHGDLCPLCGQPLTLRPTVIVRSAGVPHPTRTDYLPHCRYCATNTFRAQEWSDLMRARYES
ncbi:hypothetical protein C6N75_10520 [Streptomyces solincola]|uniref:Uncharacterized protein n=1 Tax=Streptomyces solincola TaxID=2100817 RepID=A0A2S9PY09_9ACTN|nr:hypothetical protein [Streptomyces solincola]PRH79243.1 hypothetical protein C6N75_10520 [Streptomyces solincola]